MPTTDIDQLRKNFELNKRLLTLLSKEPMDLYSIISCFDEAVVWHEINPDSFLKVIRAIVINIDRVDINGGNDEEFFKEEIAALELVINENMSIKINGFTTLLRDIFIYSPTVIPEFRTALEDMGKLYQTLIVANTANVSNFIVTVNHAIQRLIAAIDDSKPNGAEKNQQLIAAVKSYKEQIIQQYRDAYEQETDPAIKSEIAHCLSRFYDRLKDAEKKKYWHWQALGFGKDSYMSAINGHFAYMRDNTMGMENLSEQEKDWQRNYLSKIRAASSPKEEQITKEEIEIQQKFFKKAISFAAKKDEQEPEKPQTSRSEERKKPETIPVVRL